MRVGGSLKGLWCGVALLQRPGEYGRGKSAVSRYPMSGIEQPVSYLVLLNWRGQEKSAVVKPYLVWIRAFGHGFSYQTACSLPRVT